MGGGLIELIAYGVQDIYLTGNPQITFFKVIYRRHTNFTIESIAQEWTGRSDKPGTCVSTIARNGDLISDIYLELKGTTAKFKCNASVLGITSAELEIGGQMIDKQSGIFMETWAELTEPNPSARVGVVKTGPNLGALGTQFQNMSGFGGVGNNDTATKTQQWYVPFYFWFCKDTGLALPLIALQYHEVKLILNHTFGTGGPMTDVTNTLWCEYIFLDTDERRRFAQVSHEYLIEQVQEQTLHKTSSTSLKFNHPVKELIWTCDDNWTTEEETRGGILCSGTPPEPHSSGKHIGTEGICSRTAEVYPKVYYQLRFNGHDRFDERDWRYFTRVQVWQHHSGNGGYNSNVGDSQTNTDHLNGQLNDSIGVYSFALKPEEHQPSGTCNFSRIDEAQFIPSGETDKNHANRIFAINYNILRIMSGMGGLAYSN